MLDALKNMDNTLSFCLCSYAGRVWERRIYLSLNQVNTCFLYSCFNAKRETEDIFCRQRAIDEFADEVKVATR